MKRFFYTIAFAAAALCLASCNGKKEEPTPDPQPILPVKSFSATPGVSQVELSWVVYEGSEPDAFKLTYGITGQSTESITFDAEDVAVAGGFAYTVSELVNDEEYTFEIFASFEGELSTGVKAVTTPFDPTEAKDLSHKGTAVANSYILNGAPGAYRIPAAARGGLTTVTSGDASVVINNPRATAIVYWESTAGMLTDAVYDPETNYISFMWNGTKGNALIALIEDIKASGPKALWTWHIWATDTPADQTIGSHAYMDRNLGAIAVPTSKSDIANYICPDDKDARSIFPTKGLLYQWGRLNPLPEGSCSSLMYFHDENHLRDNGLAGPAVRNSAAAGCQEEDAWYNRCFYNIHQYNFPGLPSWTDGERQTFYKAIGGSTWRTESGSLWRSSGWRASNLLEGVAYPACYMGANDDGGDGTPVTGEKRSWSVVFGGNWDFGSSLSPWNYGVADNKVHDPCPAGYHVGYAEDIRNDFKTLDFKWVYGNTELGFQEGYVPESRLFGSDEWWYIFKPSLVGGGCYAENNGSLVWIPATGMRMCYGAYTDIALMYWNGASNNNREGFVVFAPYNSKEVKLNKAAKTTYIGNAMEDWIQGSHGDNDSGSYSTFAEKREKSVYTGELYSTKSAGQAVISSANPVRCTKD